MLKLPRSEDGSLRDNIPQAGLRAAALSFSPVTPHREAIQKSKNQEAKRNLIPTKSLKTAAKRRWGLGMKSPSGAWGGNPIVTPRSPNREAIQKNRNQGAKRNLIPLTRRQTFPSSFDIVFSISHPPLPRNVPTGSFWTYRKLRKTVRVSKGTVFCRLHRKRRRGSARFFAGLLFFLFKMCYNTSI